jgi:hypothetical protein
MSRRRWLDVDLSGLEKILGRRGKDFILYELIQNAWDEPCTQVTISLPKPEREKTRLVVSDDSPNGFCDLNHAFTLFAESPKKDQPQKRGLFNAGEKFVLACCEEASILSTRGGILFGAKGRRRTKRRTQRGTEFSGLLRLSVEEWTHICQRIPALIPPITTTFNGQLVPSRKPIHTFSYVLPTVEADGEGHVKRTTRAAEVRVYEPLPGETGTLYELGLPVVETDDKWHVEVLQKIPVNLERDNVSPSYLQTVRVAVLNEMSALLTHEDASSTWVRQAAGDSRTLAAAFNTVMDLRFGKSRVTHDPSDPEANLIATSQGYTVITSAALSSDEWTNVRRFGSSLPAGRVTPSPKPFSLVGEPLKLLAPENKTAEHCRFEKLARILGQELLNRSITVTFADDLSWRFAGCYGKSELTVNIKAKSRDWFTGPAPQLLENWIPFLIHEFAHDAVQGHLSDAYHRECCRLAGKLASFLFRKSSSLLPVIG